MPSTAARLEAGHDMLIQLKMLKGACRGKGLLQRWEDQQPAIYKYRQLQPVLAHIRSGVSTGSMRNGYTDVLLKGCSSAPTAFAAKSPRTWCECGHRTRYRIGLRTRYGTGVATGRGMVWKQGEWRHGPQWNCALSIDVNSFEA
jgi:hypothetical protein